MTVSASEKQMLQDKGAWQQFCKRRDELKGEGLKPKQAQDQAMMEILGDEDFIPQPDESPKSPVPDQLPKAMEGMEALIEAMPEKSKPTDMIQWVASSLSGVVDMETCPGRDAFALYRDCRQFPSFRLDYWKTMYTKVIPSRATLTDEGGVIVLDGEQAMEVLSKISKIKQEAESEEAKDAECEAS